jgi:thymidylate synthase
VLVIQATNVNDAYAEALFKINVYGELSDSRDGKVLRCPTPVTTIYERPYQYMLFDAKRDANPFFHVMEGVWMLAGRNDVKFLERFNSKIGQFSDDDQTLNGAYGHRWRHHFGRDQLLYVINELSRDPNSRRAVMSMWDPARDIEMVDSRGKDVPCNTTIYFTRRDYTLDMTVCCRSNDIIWGCYGANAVHMAMLQKFVAGALGVVVGRYYQISNDWHMYERHFKLSQDRVPDDPAPYPHDLASMSSTVTWIDDLNEFTAWCNDPTAEYVNPFIRGVLNPMLSAWGLHKAGDGRASLENAYCIQDGAIRKACMEWLERRVK